MSRLAIDKSKLLCYILAMDRLEMLRQRLDGETYQSIANKAGISRQRVQQILSPPPAIRNTVVTRAEGTCEMCGLRVGSSGHVHHTGGGEENYNDLDNLQYLCIYCHRNAHPFSSKYADSLAVPPNKLIEIEICKCLRCNYEWWPRSTQRPARCPKCQSRNYDKPKGG